MYSSALPEARVQWVELLIAHSELIHHLWQLQYGAGVAAREQLAPTREHHADAVTALRNRCRRVVSQPRGGAPG
ncbi:MAG TPA: hypothetical protein VEB23_14250 [Ramlibacter sp.]|nr:hypothetical protein [Ramlibacter sp.]